MIDGKVLMLGPQLLVPRGGGMLIYANGCVFTVEAKDVGAAWIITDLGMMAGRVVSGHYLRMMAIAQDERGGFVIYVERGKLEYEEYQRKARESIEALGTDE